MSTRQVKKTVTVIAGILALSLSSIAGEDVFKEDFEAGTEDLVSTWKGKCPKKWEIGFNYRSDLDMNVVEGGPDGSKYCYEIKLKEGVVRDTPDKRDNACKLLSPHIPVEAGKRYQLIMEQSNTYDPSRANGKSGPRIIWYDLNLKQISESKITGFGRPNPEWHLVKTPFFQAPENATSARVRISYDWPDLRKGHYWRIDNLRLIEKSGD